MVFCAFLWSASKASFADSPGPKDLGVYSEAILRFGLYLSTGHVLPKGMHFVVTRERLGSMTDHV